MWNLFRRKNAKKVASSSDLPTSSDKSIPLESPRKARTSPTPENTVSPIRLRQDDTGSPQRSRSLHLEDIVRMVDITQPQPDLPMGRLQPTHSLEAKPVPATEATPLSQPISPPRMVLPPPVSTDLDEFQKKLVQEAQRMDAINAAAVQNVVTTNLAAAQQIQTRVTYEADRVHALLDKLSDNYAQQERGYLKYLCCTCLDP
jgi:hypothetical protein